MGQTIKKLKDYQRMDWTNVPGYSDEVVRSEDSPSQYVFDWRLAIEDVPQSGTIAPFNGFMRIFSVLEGAAIDLNINNQFENTLKTFEHVRVEGGSALMGALVAGPIRDLSLLYNNELFTAGYQWCDATSPQDFSSEAEVVLVFSAAPEITVTVNNAPQTLSHYDTLIMTENSSSQELSISGAGHACLIELFRHSA